MMLSPLGIVAVLLLLGLLGGVGWLCFVIARRARFQYSLRSLLLLVTAAALVLGAIRAWPSHVITMPVNRIEHKPGKNVFTGRALVLDIFERWGRTTIRVSPGDDFGEATGAELFWLEAGKLRHATVAEKGQVLATTISLPSQWPLLVGVVEYHPATTYVVARWVLADGRSNGVDVIYDAKEPSLQGGVEKWGKCFLEKVRDDR
ncbi:MAG: hypothetical protein ACLQLG_04005 [Thermoguttaceae bacterium]